LRNIKVKRYS